MKNFRLLVNCKDQAGIIAATTNFISKCEGNITYVDQHADLQQGVFFMRLEYTLDNTKIGKKEFVRSFESEVGSLFDMNWELSDSESRLKMALFVLNPPHIFG